MELLTYTSEFGRDRGDLPELPIKNLFAEEAPTEGKVILQSRPGLEQVRSLSTDPIRFIYSEPGVFSEDLFALAGDTLYRGATSLGTIVGDGKVSMDSYEDATFITAGSKLYQYDGTALSEITFPDNAETLRLVVGASRLIVIKKDSQTIYWSSPLSSDIDELDFAQAENSPDRLLDMLFLGDVLLLFGEATVEFWSATTSGDVPFAPIPGRVFSKGIKTTGAATKLASGFAWVTDTNQICFNTPENIISTREIEESIEKSSDVSLWPFFLDSIEFLVVRVDEKTYVMNTVSKTVTEFTTFGENNWEANSYSNGYFGSAVTGRILQWSETYADDSAELQRIFRVWYPMNMNTEIVSNVFVRANTGRTPYTIGNYVTPTLEMRTSKDGGNTWGDWRQASMGAIGNYRKQIKFLRLGMFSYPGALAEFRISDPVPFRVSSVTVNEKFGSY